MARQLKMIGIDDFRRPAAQVAVLCRSGLLYLRRPAREEKPHQFTPQEDSEAHGLYAALSDSHVPADVIFTAQLADGAISRYKAIVLAGARLMDDKTAAQLKKFADNGGHPRGRQSAGDSGPLGQRAARPDAGPPCSARGSKSIRLSGERAGLAYMNQPNLNLRRQILTAVMPVLSGARATASDPQANVSILQDGRGNLLTVATTLGNRGQLAPELDNVSLTITAPGQFAKAFILGNATDDVSLAKELPFNRTQTGVSVNVGRPHLRSCRSPGEGERPAADGDQVEALVVLGCCRRRVAGMASGGLGGSRMCGVSGGGRGMRIGGRFGRLAVTRLLAGRDLVHVLDEVGQGPRTPRRTRAQHRRLGRHVRALRGPW